MARGEGTAKIQFLSRKEGSTDDERTEMQRTKYAFPQRGSGPCSTNRAACERTREEGRNNRIISYKRTSPAPLKECEGEETLARRL